MLIYFMQVLFYMISVKVKEFTGPIVPAYSIEGSLVGHISIGHAMVKEMAERITY